MKIPDIAWPTFFDSYRESMLRLSFTQSLHDTKWKVLQLSCLLALAKMVFYFLLKLNIPEGPEYENTTLDQSRGESLTRYKDSWCENQVF